MGACLSFFHRSSEHNPETNGKKSQHAEQAKPQSILPPDRRSPNVPEAPASKPKEPAPISQSIQSSRSSKHRSIEVHAVDINPKNPVEKVFMAYSGGSEILTMEDGGLIVDFFNALNLPLEQGEALAAFYLLNAQDFSELRLEEVKNYCRNRSITSFEELNRNLNSAAASVFASSKSMKQCFMYIFHTSKKSTPESKNLSADMALPLLKMLLLSNKFFKPRRVVQQFYDFLENAAKPLTKDEWGSIADFLFSYSDDLSSYELDSAWPTLFDSFVRQMQEAGNRV